MIAAHKYDVNCTPLAEPVEADCSLCPSETIAAFTFITGPRGFVAYRHCAACAQHILMQIGLLHTC